MFIFAINLEYGKYNSHLLSMRDVLKLQLMPNLALRKYSVLITYYGTPFYNLKYNEKPKDFLLLHHLMDRKYILSICCGSFHILFFISSYNNDKKETILLTRACYNCFMGCPHWQGHYSFSTDLVGTECYANMFTAKSGTLAVIFHI